MVAVVSIRTVHLRSFENDQAAVSSREGYHRENIKRTRVDDCQAANAMVALKRTRLRVRGLPWESLVGWAKSPARCGESCTDIACRFCPPDECPICPNHFLTTSSHDQ